MTETLAGAVDLLHKIVDSPSERKSLIDRFQGFVWHDLPSTTPQRVAEVLRALALDLDYFEADPEIRAESPDLLDDVAVQSEIRAALEALANLEPN
jgi:hypothetical protein